jgi:cytochrome c55X
MHKVSIGWGVAVSGALVAGALHAGEPAPERRAQLVEMVRQDCGSCHGLTLKGGLGPPLLPAALGDKDAVSLQYTILDGRRGTAMPPWRPFMREDEALWIVHALKNGLPERERK